MNSEPQPSDIRRNARLAGVLYLLVVLSGIFCLIYTPSQTIVPGNPAETASLILAHETLYRIDVTVGLISTILFMFLGLALYQMFKDVDRRQALVMVVLLLVQIPQSFVTLLLQLGALELVRGADYLSVFNIPQREVLAMLCINVNSIGTHLSEIFWGLWLFPLAVLVIRSSFLPRFLGIWLIVNGVAYVLMSISGLVTPHYYAIVAKFAMPALIGEVVFTFWLLFGSVKSTKGTATLRPIPSS